MTAHRPTPAPARFDAAGLWAASFPVGLVLLLLGQRAESAMGTGLVVAAIACFAIAVVAVATVRRPGARPSGDPQPGAQDHCGGTA